MPVAAYCAKKAGDEGRSYAGTRGRWFWFSFSKNHYAKVVRSSVSFLEQNKLLEAHMPTKRQSTSKHSRAGMSKPNLGQEEAKLEKTGKEQMSHMESGKASGTSLRQPTKRGTKSSKLLAIVLGPNYEFATETPEEFYYDKERLLANGDSLGRKEPLARRAISIRSRHRSDLRAVHQWPRTIRIRQDASLTTAEPPIAVARDQVIDLVRNHLWDRWRAHVHCHPGSSRAMRRAASDFM